MFSSKYDDFEDRGKFVLAKELTPTYQQLAGSGSHRIRTSASGSIKHTLT